MRLGEEQKYFVRKNLTKGIVQGKGICLKIIKCFKKKKGK